MGAILVGIFFGLLGGYFIIGFLVLHFGMKKEVREGRMLLHPVARLRTRPDLCGAENGFDPQPRILGLLAGPGEGWVQLLLGQGARQRVAGQLQQDLRGGPGPR